MVNISTNIGNIKLLSCTMNASGCHCTTKEELDNLESSQAGAIVSKSSTILARTGNKCPRYFSNKFGTINSMGIPNYGYEFYLTYGLNTSKTFIQSIYPFDLLELRQMLILINKSAEKAKIKYIVEVNLSCPNIKDKTIASYDIYSLKSYCEIIKNNADHIIIGLKLPPFYDLTDYDRISDILLKYKEKIQFITCSNSIVNGLMIDYEKEETVIHPKDGLGGIGGIYCKPICLANVYNFYKRLGDQIAIIGCGGITNGKDVFEYILCGASAVQIGSHLLNTSTKCFEIIENELRDIMKKKNYTKLDDFRGSIKIIDSN